MRGFTAIGLDNAKDPLNIGSALRAAHCFDSSLVAVSGARSIKRWGSIPTDTPRAHRHIPLLRVDDLFDVIPFGCVPVAVDLIDGATPLQDYTHPDRAFYIFGAEDQTLGDRILSRCRDIVYVPTNNCMNLAAAVNVVLYDRMTKR